jgi:glucan phosphoethanolaminetransferase (alkaline phosphatase superfamily)
VEGVLYVLFFLIATGFNLSIMFWKKGKLLKSKAQLAYTNGILTVVFAIMYSLLINSDSFTPEFVRVFGILSVLSIVIMIFTFFIKFYYKKLLTMDNCADKLFNNYTLISKRCDGNEDAYDYTRELMGGENQRRICMYNSFRSFVAEA